MKYKKIITMIAIIGLSVGAIALYTINKNETENVMANMEVRESRNMLPITTVTRETLKDTITGTGYTTTEDAEYVYPTYSGIVENVLVSVNDKVEVGDVILTYDTSDTLNDYYRSIEEKQISLENEKMDLDLIYSPNNSIEQAQSTIEDLQLDYQNKLNEIEEAKEDIDLYKDYYERGIESKSSYESKITVYDDLLEDLSKIETSIATANKNLENATLQLENNYKQKENSIRLLQIDIEEINSNISKIESNLVSNVSGTVTEVSSVGGKTTTLGQEVIEVINYENLIVTSEVSEYDISEIYIGQQVQLYSDGNPEKIYEGEVVYIGNEAVSTGEVENSVPIEIMITDDNATDLKAGFTLNVEMITLNIENALTLDATVLQKDDNGDSYVYLVGDNSTINKQVIAVGEQVGTKVVVNDGLNENDRIITSMFELIEENMTLEQLTQVISENMQATQEESSDSQEGGFMDSMIPSTGGGEGRGGGGPSGGGGSRP